MSEILVSCYSSTDHAQDAVAALRDHGVDPDRIGILLADSGDARDLLEGGPASPREGAAVGSVTGATLFGLAAVALATGPVGVLAVGPLAALVGGGVAGATTGGLLGALVGLGIPENEAALRVEEIHKGGVLVTVHTRDETERRKLEELLSTGSARHVFAI